MEQTTDWKKVYEKTREHTLKAVRYAFFAGSVFGIFFLSAGISSFLENREHGDMFGTYIFWTVGLIGTAFCWWKALWDGTECPVALRGKILKKEGDPRHPHHSGYLCLEVEDAYGVMATGQTKNLPNLTGRKKIIANFNLFKQMKENEDVTLLCLPSGEAFAKVEDLI